MTQEHPITPPPELVEQWRTAPEYTTGKEMFTMVSVSTRRLQEVATQAARWGYQQCMKLDAAWLEAKLQKARDEELEACCEWVGAISGKYGPRLRLARRPKPPNLKELALEVLDDIDARLDAVHCNILRRAIEFIPD